MNSAERRKQTFLQNLKSNCSLNIELKELKEKNQTNTPRFHGKLGDIRHGNSEKKFMPIARINVAQKQQQKERYEQVRINRDKIERPWLYPIETAAINHKPVKPTPTGKPPLMYSKLIKIDLPKTSIRTTQYFLL
jgi:hypothetical protein